MTARATWNGTVIAESDDTVIVEGNHYFPRASVNEAFLQPSDAHTFCGWKGEASYFSVSAGGLTVNDAAWYYPDPYDAASPIRDWVAFWNGVEVTAEPGDGTPGPTPPGR